jgi:2-polyprenyl-3-methyl-5-hydroxy-6-metoxy-1,4-benzoquinol methylase
MSTSARDFLTFIVHKRDLKQVLISDAVPEYEKYDRIVVLDVLEHIPDPIGLIKYLKQFLREDGIFIISAPFNDFISPTHLHMHAGLTVPKVMNAANINSAQYKDMTR